MKSKTQNLRRALAEYHEPDEAKMTCCLTSQLHTKKQIILTLWCLADCMHGFDVNQVCIIGSMGRIIGRFSNLIHRIASSLVSCVTIPATCVVPSKDNMEEITVSVVENDPLPIKQVDSVASKPQIDVKEGDVQQSSSSPQQQEQQEKVRPTEGTESSKIRKIRKRSDISFVRFQSIVRNVLTYNSLNPIEQPFILVPIAVLLGTLSQSFCQQCSFQVEIMFCSICLCTSMIVFLWLAQERLAVMSYWIRDPFDMQEEHLISEKSKPGTKQQQQVHPPSEHSDSEREITEQLDEFFSFASCVRNRKDHTRTFTADQETAIRVVMDRYFNKSSGIWNESQYLCVNDDARWGAIRALDARKFNVGEACLLIENNIKWRRQEGINHVFTNRKLSEDDVYKMRLALGDGFFALDKSGHPIWWCPAGSVHLNALKAQVPLENLLWLHVIMVEFNQRVWFRALSQTRTPSTPAVYQMTIVLDLTGFGISNVRGGFYECLNSIGKVDEEFYYENVFRVYIINAPSFFRFFWRTLSPLFDPATRVKFVVLDSPRDLHHYIHPSYIPRKFGGRFDDDRHILFNPETKETVYTKHLDDFLKQWHNGEIRSEQEYLDKTYFHKRKKSPKSSGVYSVSSSPTSNKPRQNQPLSVHETPSV